jgi:molecular chaperone HscC
VSGIFSPIIDRGTVIPTSRVESFVTSTDGQTRLEIDVYQDEHADCDKNTLLSSYVIPDIPPARAGTQRVDVRFSYDLSGLLVVETTVASTGVKHELVIERTPGTLSPTEVEAIRASIQRVAFHPRESLPNTTALARAEALYLELTGEARRVAGSLIARFRGSLETQDPVLITAAREALSAFVRDHSRD